MNGLLGASSYAATGRRFAVVDAHVLWTEKVSTLGELRGAAPGGITSATIAGLAAPIVWSVYGAAKGTALRWLEVANSQVGSTTEYSNTATVYSAPFAGNSVSAASAVCTTTFLSNLSDV
jgi:hypothetical protein